MQTTSISNFNAKLSNPESRDTHTQITIYIEIKQYTGKYVVSNTLV